MSSKLLGSPGEVDIADDNGSDARIVEQCLEGDQEAWEALMGKYRRLIQSIPLKYGASPDDAADIFQAVALDLFADLPKIRQPRALRGWLTQVTSHKCLQWKEAQRRRAEDDLSQIESHLLPSLIVPPIPLEAVEEGQRLREAVARLPLRFRRLIHMLFYDQPPHSYKEIAKTLGVARGSIPFLRARCLKHLQQIMEELEVEHRVIKAH